MSHLNKFQSYPNTYCTKLKGTPSPPQIALVTPKNGHPNMPRPIHGYKVPTFAPKYALSLFHHHLHSVFMPPKTSMLLAHGKPHTWWNYDI